MADPPSNRPRSFYVYTCQWFCLVLQSSPEPRIQNHAEFVSLQTVVALARNAHIATRRMDTKHSLLELLGIEPVGPAGALQSALVLQDEVCSDCLSIRGR